MKHKIEFTTRQAQALYACLGMVLSITGDIKKGDPDFKPLCTAADKIRDSLMDAKQPLLNRSA